MPVSEQTYLKVALEDDHTNWELHRGQLRSKPDMTAEHNDLMMELGFELRRQLPRDQHHIRVNAGRIRRSESHYYIPDVFVIPASLARAQRQGAGHLEIYPEPLPLVVEVWSPATDDYDVEEKLPEYRDRGDLEIWRIHPYERTLTRWLRQPDGTYAESLHLGGSVQPAALPGVVINLDHLFEA